jgi:predicted transcriptional regulator
MRITVTLDPDVAAALKALQEKQTGSRKNLLNEALCRGLDDMNRRPEGREKFQTRPVNMGRALVNDIDNIADVLAIAEGEDFK